MLTTWALIGTITYIWHNVYVWDYCSSGFKKEITTFKFFIATVVVFPVIWYILLKCIIEVEAGLRKWKKGDGL
ncbi:hypothetical protein VPH166E361_0180 [Vibrio phage 166E36-1]